MCTGYKLWAFFGIALKNVFSMLLKKHKALLNKNRS